jgi:hypothetical protein
MFFQTSYNHAVVKAKLWPVAAKSKASKTTLELYEDTLETMLMTQKGVFAFERMREKLIRRHVEAAAEAEEGSLRKGKHKKATKAATQNEREVSLDEPRGSGVQASSGKVVRLNLLGAKEKAKEKADEPSSSESDEDEELAEELSTLELMETGLKHVMEVDQRLRNRLEILHIALDEDWEVGKCAQELLQEDNSESLRERARKSANDKRKAKKEEEGQSGPKKRRIDRRESEYYGGRGRFKRKKPGPRNNFGGYGYDFDGYAESYYDRQYERPRYSGPASEGYSGYTQASAYGGEQRSWGRERYPRTFQGGAQQFRAPPAMMTSRPPASAPLPPPPPPPGCFRCGDLSHKKINCAVRQ